MLRAKEPLETSGEDRQVLNLDVSVSSVISHVTYGCLSALHSYASLNYFILH